MSQSIINALEEKGPCLTSELIEYLVKQERISDSAARQRISRAEGDIKKLAGLRLAHGARFIYLEEDYGKRRFWKALESTLKESGKSYWATITALKGRGGWCPAASFPIVCGNPIRRKHQLSPHLILKRLSAINMLETKELTQRNGKLSCVKFKQRWYPDIGEAHFRAQQQAEDIALNGVKEWARRLGFGSYEQFRMRGEPELPLVASVAWDLSAPSYIRPLVSMQKGKLKPGFFVCDLYSGSVNEDLVDAFIRKYNMTTAPKNVAPVMALLVADRFESSAFRKAKSAGVLPVTISNLLGKDIANALKDLIQVLTNASVAVVKKPEELEHMMKELSRIEGASHNLRSAMFELIIGILVKDVEDGYLTNRCQVGYVTEKAEVDILLDKRSNNETLVIECKAKALNLQVGLNDVKKWFENRVPLINKALRQDDRYKNKEIRFELWTNGTFYPSAQKWLNEMQMEFDGYSLGWRDKTRLKRYAQRSKEGAIKRMLNEHYFRQSLSRAKQNIIGSK